MRSWSIAIAASACSSSSHAVPDAAPLGDAFLSDDASDGFDNRQVDSVVVGATQVQWARGDASCPIALRVTEGGPCPVVAPTLLSAPLANGTAVTRVTSMMGIAMLAGDDSGVFFLDRDLSPKTSLARLRGGHPEELLWTTTQSLVIGPVVDASDVYWFAGTALYHASRTGDGSDAAILAMGVNPSTQVVTFAGSVWWSYCSEECILYRVAPTGGAVETVATGFYVLGASATALYGLSDDRSQIVAFDANAKTTVVVDQLAQLYTPLVFVADSSDLFWMTNTGIMRVPAAGGTPTTVPGVTLNASTAFGLTADALLYNFDTTGYQTLAR